MEKHMRSLIAGLLVLVAAPCFAQGMRVTWPNGASLTAGLGVDDSTERSPILVTTTMYRYDYRRINDPFGNPPPLARLRVRYLSDGTVTVKWFGDKSGESGRTRADGSAPFTVRLFDDNRPNLWKDVTVTPVP